MKLFVGNLDFSVQEDELKALFSAHGPVTKVKIVTDRNTGKPKGFAFLEYDDDVAAIKSMYDLNDAEFKGRKIQVREKE